MRLDTTAHRLGNPERIGFLFDFTPRITAIMGKIAVLQHGVFCRAIIASGGHLKARGDNEHDHNHPAIKSNSAAKRQKNMKPFCKFFVAIHEGEFAYIKNRI